MKKKNLFLFFILPCNLIFAGITGKLVGNITDAFTGEPLIGVNLVLKGTVLGAATDQNGYYKILNISAGSFTATASYIGFKTTSVTDVRINADRTTTLNFEMQISAVDG